MLQHRNLKSTGFHVEIKHVHHMSLSSKITRGKGSRVLDCQRFEKPNSLILRSWLFRKTANMSGTWEKVVRIYWMSQSYFLEMPLRFASQRKLPNSDSKLHKADSAVMPQRMSLQDRRVAKEWNIEHGGASKSCTQTYKHHKSEQGLKNLQRPP